MDELIEKTHAKVEAVDKVIQAWMTPENIMEAPGSIWTDKTERTDLKNFYTANFETTTGFGKLISDFEAKAGYVELDQAAAPFSKGTGYYALAIADSTINGKQAYLTVDTNYVAENEKYVLVRSLSVGGAWTIFKKWKTKDLIKELSQSKDYIIRSEAVNDLIMEVLAQWKQE